MTIKPITSTSLQGIRHGLQGIRRNAVEIASQSQANTALPSKDHIRALVELHQNAHQVSASAKVFNVADQMIGSLLDIKA